MVDEDKWILYKHTCNYELIKAVALDVKNNCATVNETERYRMQERLAALELYRTRNPDERPLDSINHRINTLEFYMFGYEEVDADAGKRFIFSPLGNFFLTHINKEEKLPFIFAAMLFGIQFEHPANGTPGCFSLFPFRLLFQLLTDNRLENKLYHTEYAYLVTFVHENTPESYDNLVKKILAFRQLEDDEKFRLLLANEHTSVNAIYEWQYYTIKLLVQAGIFEKIDGKKLGKLYHPPKTNSHSGRTGRSVLSGYVKITFEIKDFIIRMLKEYSPYQKPLPLNDPERLYIDVVKQIYSFFPRELSSAIGEEENEIQHQLLELPKLIEQYSKNPENETAYLFEDVLTQGFNMFYNVNAQKIGGAGNTDIECLYITRNTKFAVEAKSTANKLIQINAGRLREHRMKIGGEYTIVVTSKLMPAVIADIKNQPIVVILASTFGEYLYNHLFHDIREIDFKDFDDIIISNFGSDISKLISNMTMEKFASKTNDFDNK